MKVSVIITSYNYARFVREAIESALNQTRPPHEVIVIDDGSTDDTAKILNPYAGTARVRYHYQKNAGLCAARNAGLALATGDAFALLDADDAWHPAKLAYQVAHLESHPECGLVGTGSARGESIDWADWPEIGTPGPKNLPVDTHLTRTRFCPSSALFRRSLWEQIGGFDPAAGGTSDRDYWIRSAAVSGVDRIEQPLTFYRVHGGSMTATKVDAMIASERAVLDKSFRDLPALRGKRLLRSRSHAMADLSAAYTLWHDAGRPRSALGPLVRSMLSWPLPLPPGDLNCSFPRLRLGARLVAASLRK